MSACDFMDILRNDEGYWREKLAAFLHDPPDKALSLKGHIGRAKEIAGEFYVSADEVLVSKADQVASGLDRTFLPGVQEGGLIDFRKRPIITHPTGQAEPLDLGHIPECSVEDVIELIRKDEQAIVKSEVPKAFSIFHYFRHVLPHRLASENICSLGWRWLRLPADTRLPDHSIWQHCSLTSALYSCYKLSPKNKASLMVFSITPVQDFISRSRKLRDYWSSSLILSWLASEGIKSVILQYGSDHIIYPYPVGQPLIEDFFDKNCGFSEQWKTRYSIVTEAATLPNKFLFLLPAGMERMTAEVIMKCINEAWLNLSNEIKKKIYNWCFRKADIPDDCTKAFEDIFDRQVKSFWEFHWAAVPLVDSDLLGQLKTYLPETLVNSHEEYFNDAQNCKLPFLEHTEKFFYSLSYDLANRGLAAEKLSPQEHRTPEPGIKCHLHPDLEALRFSCVECNKKECFVTKQKPNHNPRPSEDPCWKTIRNNWRTKTDFKETERLSSIGLIKRVAYRVVDEDHPLFPFFNRAEAFPSTTEIAAQDWLERAMAEIEKEGLTTKKVAEVLHRSDSPPKDLNEIAEVEEGEIFKIQRIIEKRKNAKDRVSIVDHYYAILIMDGDRMGHLLSGGFAARWKDVLHPDLVERLKKGEIDDKFYPCFWPKFLDKKRILSPATHGAISQALAEYSLFSVPYIVTKHKGKLIYAGGDDICAVFPVSKALDAALDLAKAYIWAFVKWDGKETCEIGKEGEVANGDSLLLHLGPGEEISISGGLLIAHHKWPLRAAIQRAHALLGLAKESKVVRNGKCIYKAAFALEFQRRAGERRTFVAGWKDEKLGVSVWEAFKDIVGALSTKNLSSSLIYRLAELEDGLKVVPDKDLPSFISSQIKKDDSTGGLEKSIASVFLGERLEGKTGIEALQIASFLSETMKRSG